MTGVQTPYTKKGRKWFIEGVDKGFRSKDAVEKYLSGDLDFINAGIGGKNNG